MCSYPFKMALYETTFEIETFSHCENPAPIQSFKSNETKHNINLSHFHIFTPLKFPRKKASQNLISSSLFDSQNISLKSKVKPYSSENINNDLYYNLSDISDLDLDSSQNL